MKNKLKKIGMIALFLVTGSQEQVMKMFGDSPTPVSNEVKAQAMGYYKLSDCLYRSGGGMHLGHKCTYTGTGCNVYNTCG